MTFDPSELLEIFIAEAEEQLTVMDQALLALEKDPASKEAIDSLFRAAHTLKASAAAQGFDEIASLSHALESAMDRVRAGDIQFTPDMADVLLGAVDALRNMVEAVTSGSPPQGDISELLAQLRAIAGEEEAPQPQGAPHNPEAATEAQQQCQASSDTQPDEPETTSSAPQVDQIKKDEIHRVAITPSEQCLMPAARAWLWLQQISEWGKVLLTVPKPEELKQGELPAGKLIVVLGSDLERETILEKARALPEVGHVEVTDPRQDDLEKILGPSGGDEKAQEQGQIQVAPTVRVKVAHLEALMKLVGELVLCRARLVRQLRKIEANSDATVGIGDLQNVADELSSIVSELRDEVMRARLVPLEHTFLRFSRVVRDAARREGKEVEFVIEGGETEVDRTIAESIVDPLKHLLRNAVSHGIEPPDEREAAGKPRAGKVVLKAQHLEGNILITVSDDGRGIDPNAIRKAAVRKGLLSADRAASLTDQEAIELLFQPGFSTKDEVTDVSGRGVGLDVVRASIEEINGRVEISTALGKGTTFSLHLPLTLAIMPALIVENNSQLYGLPLLSVLRIIAVDRASVSTVAGRMATNHLGKVLHLVELSELVGEPIRERDELIVLVVQVGDKEIGLIVDRVIGEQEIVIRPLPGFLPRCRAIAGVATIGEGEFVLVLDVPTLGNVSAAARAA